MVDRLKIHMDFEACAEAENMLRYIRAITEDTKTVSNIRRARKELCKAMDKKYCVEDEVQ